jgi:hypothetical protein
MLCIFYVSNLFEGGKSEKIKKNKNVLNSLHILRHNRKTNT